MSKDISKFLKSATVYTVLSFLPAGMGLLLTPLFTNHLASTSEFGLLTLANFFFAFFAVCIGLGFDSAYGVMYFHYSKNPSSQKSLLHTILILILGTFLFVGGVLWIGGNFLFRVFLDNERFTYEVFGQYALIMALSTVLNSVLLAYHRNKNNLKAFSIQSIALAVVPVAAQFICLFYVSNTAQAVVKYRSVSSLLTVVVFASLFFLKDGIYFRKSFIKPLFQLSLPFALYSLIIFLFENIDRPIVDRGFNDLHLLSVYGLALTFSAIAELLRVSVASALSPAIFQIMAQDNDPVKINQLYRLFIWILYLFVCLLLVAVQPIFLLFIKNKDFFQALDYIPFLLLGMIPKAYYSLYQLPLSYHSRIKMLPVFNFISLVLGLTVFLLSKPYLHIYAVLLSLFVSRSLQATLTFVCLKKNGTIYRKEEFHFANEWNISLVTLVTIISCYVLYKNSLLPFFAIGLISALVLVIKGYKAYGVFLRDFWQRRSGPVPAKASASIHQP